MRKIIFLSITLVLIINQTWAQNANDYKMTFTTTKPIGSTITVSVNADEEDLANIWIDLNNNEIQDEGEAITQFAQSKVYTIESQEINIYGKVRNFSCCFQSLTSLDVSQNTALKKLFCFNNKINILDISQNTNLTLLSCNNNHLNSLDVSQNINLTELVCNDNFLSSLELGQNINLKQIYTGFNLLNSLDISQCTALTRVYCDKNNLSNLDVSQNINLEYFNCGYNEITELDVSQNTALKSLGCDNNEITELDVSQNINLEDLHCRANNIEVLDLSPNTALTELSCGVNKLTNLNLANNNNSNIVPTTYVAHPVDIKHNPNLECIQVDNGFTPPSSWLKDATAEWNNDSSNPCNNGTGINSIPSDKSLTIYPNPAKEVVYIENTQTNVKMVEVYDITGGIVKTIDLRTTQSINIDQLKKGVYFVKVGGVVQKFVKQ